MRRAFRSSVLGMKPNQIVFLGDLFDGGPYLTLEEYVLVLSLPHLCVLKFTEAGRILNTKRLPGDLSSDLKFFFDFLGQNI